MYFFNIVIWLQGFESKVCVCVWRGGGGRGGDFPINARWAESQWASHANTLRASSRILYSQGRNVWWSLQNTAREAKIQLKFEKRIFLYVPSQTNDSLPSWEQCCVDSLVLHNLLKYIQTEQCIYISLSHDKIMCNKSLNLAYIEQYLASVHRLLTLALFFVFNRLNQELFLTTF